MKRGWTMSVTEIVAVLALFSMGCFAQVDIDSPPEDETVFVGGNAIFNCTANEGGTPLAVGWQFTPPNSSITEILITGSNLSGIGMVTVSDVLRTTLNLSDVELAVNGSTVVCAAVGSVLNLSDPATLFVMQLTNSSTVMDDGGCDTTCIVLIVVLVPVGAGGGGAVVVVVVVVIIKKKRSDKEKDECSPGVSFSKQ